MGMVDSQSHSSSNRASMDGTGDEKEEEAKAPELVPTCWGYSEAYFYLEANICTPKKSSSRSLVGCLQWRRWLIFSPNCRMSCHQGEIQTLSHRKPDAIYAYYGSWLKEEGFLPCPVERQENLWPLLPLPQSWRLGSRRHSWFLNGGELRVPAELRGL